MLAVRTYWRKAVSCREDVERTVHDPQMNHMNASKTALNSLRLFRWMHGSSFSCCSKSCGDVIHGNVRVMHSADTGSSFGSNSCRWDSAIFNPVTKKQNDHSVSTRVQLNNPPNAHDSLTDSSKALDSFLPHRISSSRRGLVSELKDGDPARNIVEIIFQSNWLKDDIPYGKVEKVMKVLNDPKVVGEFEEYRDTVKAKASKLHKKQPRCIVDGNELLRFYCTTMSCTLGMNGSSLVCCTFQSCSLCNILRFGFQSNGQLGIYTTASSGKAHDTALSVSEQAPTGHGTRAMLICRVIAGRVKKIFQQESQDGHNGFDAIAGEAGPYTNAEDLFVFNPKAVLPCFIVTYSC
eukprot:c2587_g1_i2 orf=451-1500(+)